MIGISFESIKFYSSFIVNALLFKDVGLKNMFKVALPVLNKMNSLLKMD